MGRFCERYAKCIQKGIPITSNTSVDFDAKELRRIGPCVTKMRGRSINNQLKTHEIILIESLSGWTYQPDHDAFMRGIKEFSKHTEKKSNKDIPQKTIPSSGFKLGIWVG